MAAANRNFTVREETTEDAVLAAKLLRSRKEIDSTRIFVLGHSLGGTLAPRIAAEDGALGGIIVVAGATRPLQDVAREQLVYLSSITPGAPNPEEGLQALLKRAPDSYWKDLDAYQPAQVATFKNLSSASRIDRAPRRAILRAYKKGNMPTSITLNDRLAERVAVLAAEAGQPIDVFVERVLQGLVDADIEIRDGIPVFRMLPDAPVLTSADVDRLLHSDLHQ